MIVELLENLRDNDKEATSEEREENDHDKDHATDAEGNAEVRVHEEVEDGESEGEEDFPNEEGDGGEEMDEEKASKPKATSDSDDEAPGVTKEESVVNTISSAKQRTTQKKLMNQFNFFERCALTEEIILRVYNYPIFLT